MSKHDARIARALENVVMQLRRRNDMTEAFYREVLDVLTQAKDLEGSPFGSGQPAAESACEVCGKAGSALCESGPLTRLQWLKHHNDCYLGNIEAGAAEEEAVEQAHEDMRDTFGSCPEES